MPIILCPSCNAKGSVPDGFPGGRIKCPKCGNRFEATGQPKATPPASPAGPAPPPPTIFDTDLGDITIDVSEPREPQGPGAVLVVTGEPERSPLLYGAIALGGVATLLLMVVVVLLVRGSGQATTAPTPEIAAETRAAPVVVPTAPEPPRTAPIAVKAAVDLAPTSTASAPAPAAPAAPTVIERLKEATAYIKLRVNGRVVSSGTGFVVDAEGDTVLLATNRHVALPEEMAAPGAVPQIEVVFRSGQGPQREQAVTARVVGADLSAELGRDLAFLTARVAGRPPQPLDLGTDREPEPTEGARYTGAGFPLGGIVNEPVGGRGNPSITITRGSVSALRRDDHGQLSVVQLDGSLQPGNSGGPIVDEATGGLIGVAVAKAAMADTIGFVIPARQLRRALDGRVGSLVVELADPARETAELKVRAQLVDPKGRLRGVLAHAVPADSIGTFGPNPDGTWPPLPGSRPIELTLDPQKSEATGRLQVALAGRRRVLVQTAHRDERGDVAYDQPRPVDLPEKPGVVAEGKRFDGRIHGLRRGSLEHLGPLIDPDKDCRLAKDEGDLKVSIFVPGKKAHSLSPEFKTRAKRSLHNAPMTLADVDGDFAATVRVAGDLNPGSELIKGPNGKPMPIAFRGAGLLLYQDRDNFIRLERCGGTTGGVVLVHRLLIEVIRDGRQAMQPLYLDLPDRDLTLLMVRRKGRIRCLFSPDGASLVAFREFALDFPSKIKVGLCAANISTRPFDVTFEDFALVDDSTTIDEEFGD